MYDSSIIIVVDVGGESISAENNEKGREEGLHISLQRTTVINDEL